jgi:hypothetical protein
MLLSRGSFEGLRGFVIKQNAADKGNTEDASYTLVYVPLYDPHGEEPRLLRGVSNHEAPMPFCGPHPSRRGEDAAPWG